MTLKEFIQTHDVDSASARITEQDIPLMESLLGASMGPQMREYVLTYGYLGYKFIELFGINSRQGPDSDMIKRTIRLHNRYPKTEGMIALEDQGDGDFCLVDGEDRVYRFLIAGQVLTPREGKLFDYILERFASIS